MTLRVWKTTMWSIFTVSLYSTIINLFGFSGKWFYGAIVSGVGLLIFCLYKIYQSKDNRQVIVKIKRFQMEPTDIFENDKYMLLKETSANRLSKISDVVYENYGKAEIEGMLEVVQNWKKDNNFEWDSTTLYDELTVEGVVDKNSVLTFEVSHKKNTKFLKIAGKLEFKGSVPNKEKLEVNLYTINGIHFYLTNVYPEDLDKTKMWSISIDESKQGTYSGVIVGR